MLWLPLPSLLLTSIRSTWTLLLLLPVLYRDTLQKTVRLREGALLKITQHVWQGWASWVFRL